MALHESALEELGLATRWVRRGAASVEEAEAGSGDVASAAAHAPTHASPEAHAVASRSEPAAPTRAEDAARATRGSSARETEPARETARTAHETEPVDRTAAPRRAAPDARPAATQPPPDDGFAWFDDLPSTPPASRTRDTSPEPRREARDARDVQEDPALPAIATLDWDALADRVASCERCRLCEKRTKTVFGVGDREADWMLVGEAPGENEDRQGEPFVGQAGKLLDNMLRALDLERGRNVYIANVIKCRPPGNRNPEPDEVARCEPYLQRQVALVKPKLIVALGRFAAQSLLKTDSSISSLRGRVHAYEGVPVIVTYHPAYLLRSLHDKSKSWADLCLARDTLNRAVDTAEHG